MLVAADRNKNWELHVAVAEEIMPVIIDFDIINYLTHASWYI